MAVEAAAGGTPSVIGTEAESLARAWPAMAAGLGAGLAPGRVAVSGVEWLGGHPTVLIAAGVGDSPGSVLVVAYHLDDLPIAIYVHQLAIAPGAVPYLLDRSGRMLTTPVTSQVGSLAPAVARQEAGRVGTSSVVQSGGSAPQVVAVVPVGMDGWHLVVMQPAPEFYGALWHADTRFRWLLLGLFVVVAGALLWLHAKRQAALHAIAEMAVKDPLTGLPNRMAFTRSLGRAMERHSRDGVDLALLFCDLDGFKAVNDHLGHDAGDLLLVAAAERIRAAATSSGGPGAMVARLGGDEFTVLLEGRRVRDRATATAKAVTDAVADPFLLKAHEVAVGISVGVAYAERGRDLLRDADLAMYRMKAVRKAAREAGEPDRFAPSPSALMRAV